MADTALGELRRAARPIEQRIERLARWRAQGLDAGESDATFPADSTDAVVFAGGGDSGSAGEGSAVSAAWLFDAFDLESATTNSFTLTGYPLENSEVVRVNGLVLEPTAEYTITGNVLEFVDIAAVRLGIGADTWRVVVSYAYFDRATPVFDPPATITGWNLNGTAVAVGSTVKLTDGTMNQAGSMVTTETIPAGWTSISLAVTIDYTPGGSRGDGFVMGLLDSTVHADTYVGGTGGDMGFGPLTGMVYAAGWIDTYSAGSEGKLSSRDASANVADASTAGYHAATGSNDYEVTFTATTPGRASAVLSWNGSPIVTSVADLYVPAVPRVILSGGTGSFVETVIVTAVTVTTDGAGDAAIATPSGTYTPPAGGTTPGTSLLSWEPPDTTGYTAQAIAAGGGTYTFDDDVDYVLSAAAEITGPVKLVGGRNIVWIGGVFGGRTTVPSGSYDGTNRGIRISDGANPNLKRVIFLEGLHFKSGTYLSDAIQIALRSENETTVILQNIRVAATNYGSKPTVHADALQCWGGPRTLYIDGFTALDCRYQGFYLDAADGRSAPTGTGDDWVVRRVNLVGGTGAKYLLVDRRPSFTNLTCDEVYTLGETEDATDSFGNWPATGLTQGAAPSGGDFVPSSLWVGVTYTSPGYV